MYHDILILKYWGEHLFHIANSKQMRHASTHSQTQNDPFSDLTQFLIHVCHVKLGGIEHQTKTANLHYQGTRE